MITEKIESLTDEIRAIDAKPFRNAVRHLVAACTDKIKDVLLTDKEASHGDN